MFILLWCPWDNAGLSGGHFSEKAEEEEEEEEETLEHFSRKITKI